MTISPREMILFWLTGLAILLGGTYWMGGPKLKEWKEAVQAQKTLADRPELTERLAVQGEEWNRELEALRDQLPQYPADKQVVADLLRKLQRIAGDNRITLFKQKPDKEERVGDLYEFSISCTWEGSLDALVHFLYAIQSQGVVYDIKSLQVAPKSGPDSLKGSFTLNCAYSRAPAEGTSGATGSEAEAQ